LPELIAASVWIKPGQRAGREFERTVESRHDSLRHGHATLESQGVADRDHRVADADGGGRTQFRGHEAGRIGHPQHGDVSVGVGCNELGIARRSAADRDGDAGCTVDHVRVGDDVAGRCVEDHSSAGALALTLEWASTGLDHRVDRHDGGLDSIEHSGDATGSDGGGLS